MELRHEPPCVSRRAARHRLAARLTARHPAAGAIQRRQSPAAVDIARYGNAIQQQSDIADASCSRVASGQHARCDDRDLLSRVQQATAEVDAARQSALKLFETLNGGRPPASLLRTQAQHSLDTLLFARPRIDQTSVLATAKPQSLPTIVTRNAVRLGPAPADLVATLDAPLTAEIEAQAAALGNAPVAIFEWVRKEIAFVPSWGSLQGAHGTLQTRRGNAMDQASLLIALLRASGVHSRT